MISGLNEELGDTAIFSKMYKDWREFYVERVRDRALPFFFRERKVGASFT